MPRTVDAATRDKIDELFNIYVNKDGTVDIAELATMIRAMGLNPSNAQIQDLVKKYDKDNSQSLTKEEFTQFYEDDSLPEPNVDADLQRAFKAFDVDGSGKVSRKEFGQALSTMGEPMTPEEIQAIFQAAGLDNKESLDFGEFRAMMGAPPLDGEDDKKKNAGQQVYCVVANMSAKDEESLLDILSRYETFMTALLKSQLGMLTWEVSRPEVPTDPPSYTAIQRYTSKEASTAKDTDPALIEFFTWVFGKFEEYDLQHSTTWMGHQEETSAANCVGSCAIGRGQDTNVYSQIVKVFAKDHDSLQKLMARSNEFIGAHMKKDDAESDLAKGTISYEIFRNEAIPEQEKGHEDNDKHSYGVLHRFASKDAHDAFMASDVVKSYLASMDAENEELGREVRIFAVSELECSGNAKIAAIAA